MVTAGMVLGSQGLSGTVINYSISKIGETMTIMKSPKTKHKKLTPKILKGKGSKKVNCSVPNCVPSRAQASDKPDTALAQPDMHI